MNVITEAKDLHALTIDELLGNLKTYEMKKKNDSERREPKKEKNLVLKGESNDSSEEDSDMTYLTKIFQKTVRRNVGIPKRDSSSRPKNYDICYKCGKPGHFIKDFPLLKQEHFKYSPAWGDSSSESEEEIDAGDISIMTVESESNEYDSIFV
ncbi:uncharacterized protein [Nicotiana sylvestris]|uniref:uncharacterized protein n=1 Tax=Nicotiana sylvestris TaxID=4096 RepID=UPI00388C38D9